MKIGTFILLQIGGLLLLSVPALAYMDVLMWGAPGMMGLVVLVGAIAYQNSQTE